MVRRSTSTSAFGVSKRESHDASAFYRRFVAPELSEDTDVAEHRALDKLIVGDARCMKEIPDSSVALVVTSPPYFAGKEYEESLGRAGVPGTYLEYLELLRAVFGECVRTLEPGGRIAVNVANLGRRPYRSLSADIIGILQDDLRLLLRGEILWVKQRGSSGSCAWGSFQRPGNPVLRDLTERVVVASKGRFDRAISARDRARRGLPCRSSMTRDDFMEDTVDLWEIPAESATRVGHPAPFPVDLPARLIDLYTYRGDLVLDPFAGSGTTAVAAVRTGRHFAGYDLDESYIRLAEDRVEEARVAEARVAEAGRQNRSTEAAPAGVDDEDGFARAVREGRTARDVARVLLEAAGFTDLEKGGRRPGGVEVGFIARDAGGRPTLFDIIGSFTSRRSGPKQTDAVWKAIGKAAVLREAGDAPLVLLATHLPEARSPAAQALARVTGPAGPVRAVIEMLARPGLAALRALCDEDICTPLT